VLKDGIIHTPTTMLSSLFPQNDASDLDVVIDAQLKKKNIFDGKTYRKKHVVFVFLSDNVGHNEICCC
jgi:hypothetical protein